MNRHRIDRSINEYLKRFKLDLKGLTLYTECASGYYAYLPILAAMAGADKIFALSRDTRYGKKEELKANLMGLSRDYDLKSRIEVVFEKEKEHLSKADIVINAASVRPIDKRMISYLKPTAVIPLMYETWEFRPEDIDISECQKRGILSLGTDEEFPGASLYPMVSYTALKLMLDAGLEVFGNRILLMGSGKNGRIIFEHFRKNGLDFKWFTLEDRIPESERKYIIKKEKLKDYLANTDCILISEHLFADELIGRKGFIKPGQIRPFTKIVHLCGNVDQGALNEHRIEYYPDRIAPTGYLSAGADYLGGKFVIELQSAGLKVGQTMARCRLRGLGLAETVECALRHAPAQDFEGGFLNYSEVAGEKR